MAVRTMYFYKNQLQLPTYHVPEDLKDHHTSKREAKSFIEIVPPKKYQYYYDDIAIQDEPKAKAPSVFEQA